MLEMDSFRKESNRKVLKNFLGIKRTQIYFCPVRINSATSQKSGATNLNCDFGVLKDCCCNIQNAITTVGGQVGYTSERVINAVERGNCDVIQAINNCCCNTQKAIIEQGYQNQLANERQTYQITNSVDSVPTLEIGKVTNVSVPVPKYGNPGMYNQEMIVDITADINGTSANFQKLPAMGDIADFGNNIVVSCNKEAMNSEVSSMKQRSLDIINSIETHQSIIKGCDEILQQLNPEIIEKQRQEQENKALREEINSLKEMFKEFINTSLKQEKHGNNN